MEYRTTFSAVVEPSARSWPQRCPTLQQASGQLGITSHEVWHTRSAFRLLGR